jgi:hypothetical protein
VLLVNAQHMKKVPGRKTDVLDCAWIAQLLERAGYCDGTARRALSGKMRKKIPELRRLAGPFRESPPVSGWSHPGSPGLPRRGDRGMRPPDQGAAAPFRAGRGSVFPRNNASSIARPETPSKSLATTTNFIPASPAFCRVDSPRERAPEADSCDTGSDLEAPGSARGYEAASQWP